MKIPDDKYRYLFILTIYIDALIYLININLLSFPLFLFCVCAYLLHTAHVRNLLKRTRKFIHHRT